MSVPESTGFAVAEIPDGQVGPFFDRLDVRADRHATPDEATAAHPDGHWEFVVEVFRHADGTETVAIVR